MHIIQNHIPGIAHSNRRYTTQILFRESPNPMEDTYIYIHHHTYKCCALRMLQRTKVYILCYISGAHKTKFIRWDPSPIAIGDRKGSGTCNQLRVAIAIEAQTRWVYKRGIIHIWVTVKSHRHWSIASENIWVAIAIGSPDPMALYNGFNRFNRIRGLNRNRNFPIDRTTCLICCDWSGGPDPVICGS